MQSFMAILGISVGVVVLILILFGISTLYKRFLGVGRAASILAFLLCLGIAGGIFALRFQEEERHDTPPWVRALFPVMAFFTTALVLKLYAKWIAGRATEAEKSTGIAGIRAWLTPGSMICAIIVAACCAKGFGASFWSYFALIIMALLAYPLINTVAGTLSTPVPSQSSVAHDELAADRERVLRMLDEKKVTADEAAELLNALGQSKSPAPTTPNVTIAPHRRLMLVGLAILLIGFFLPWFSYSPSHELARIYSDMQESIEQNQSGNSSIHINLPKMESVHIAGGDVKYGLGWWVLLIGIAAAVLPYLASTLDGRTRQLSTLIGLCVGSVILVFLLTQNMRYVSVGLILGMVGYGIQFASALKERQMVA